MDAHEFGPFATIVAVALALIAAFSYLTPRVVGHAKDWAWLADNQPKFLFVAPARVGAIVLMAAAYRLINDRNDLVFTFLAVACAAAAVASAFVFDRQRRVHIASIPEIGPDGKALLGRDGKPRVQRLVIGTEQQLRPEAAKHLARARKKHGGLSVRRFMAGYGSPVNDPENLWDETLLASIGSRLNRLLTYILLFGVLAVYLASLVIAVRL